MKLIKKFLSFIFIICLLASMLPAAFAETTDDAYFKDRSWDEVVAEFFESKRVDPAQVTLGYYNTVTGEEHFHQPDKYMVGGSVYKVPLNMAFAEKIYNGEMEWDKPLPYLDYETMMRKSIISSNNEISGTLMIQLAGGYWGFLNYVAPYLGVDTANVDFSYYNERFTARQYITCLKLLYNESERFPKIIDAMLEAEPENYFRFSERRYDIAHKYGWLESNWVLSINDVGIVYTDDPIIIACFTAGIGNAIEFISEYCTLMCDYTNYHRQQRLKAEAEEAAALEAVRADIESKALVSESIKAVPAEPEGISKLPLIIAAAVVLAALLAILFITFKQLRNKKVLICTISICASVLVFFLIASSLGVVFGRPKGDPQQTVSEFFDAISAGNYDKAYEHIADYSSLGLENTPSDAVSKAVYDALKASYKYELVGECSIDKRSASQQIELSHLELSSVKNDAIDLCIDKLREFAAERGKAKVYDESKNFLPAVTAEAFELAVNEALEFGENHSTSVKIQLQFEYDGENWLIVPNAELIHALSGGIE